MNRWAILAILLLLAACARSGQTPPSASQPTLVSPSADPLNGPLVARPLGSVDGAPLGYVEYVPPGYGDGEPRPLLVFLHGAEGAGDGTEAALGLVDDAGIPQLIGAGDWPNNRPFVVLSPQYARAAAQGRCEIGDDIAEFLGFAMQHYEIDPTRVYLTGASCGAVGMWDYFATHGDGVIAAAVPVSGYAQWALDKAGCDLAATPPVWVINGAGDIVVPVQDVRDQVHELRACEGADPGNFKLSVLPYGDHGGTIRQTYDLSAGYDIYSWFLKHTRN